MARNPLTMPPVDHPVGADDLCELLGISREQLAGLFVGPGEILDAWKISKKRLAELQQRHSDFPRPVTELKAGRIYLTGDMRRYAEAHQRELPGVALDDQAPDDPPAG